MPITFSSQVANVIKDGQGHSSLVNFLLAWALPRDPPKSGNADEHGATSCVLASIFGTSWGLLGGPAHEGNLAFLPIKLNDGHVPLGIKCNWLLLTTSYRSYEHKLKRVSSLGPFTATRQARQKAQESHITTAEELHPPQHPSAETPIVLKHPFKWNFLWWWWWWW